MSSTNNTENTEFEFRKANCENTHKQIRVPADQWADYQNIRRPGEQVVISLSDFLITDILRAGILIIWYASFEEVHQDIRESASRAPEDQYIRKKRKALSVLRIA
jgi:hypothetical protein